MAANAEQMRIASLMNDKGDNLEDLETKVNRVIEITKSNRDKAIVALHDCDHDVDRAVELILDGDIDDTWMSTKKQKNKNKSHPSGSTAGGKAAKGSASEKLNGQEGRSQRGPRDGGQRGGDKPPFRQSNNRAQKDNQTNNNKAPRNDRREPRQQSDQNNTSKPLQEKNQPNEPSSKFPIDTFDANNERQPRPPRQGDNGPRGRGPRGPPRGERPPGKKEPGERRGEGNRGPRTFSNRSFPNKNQNDNSDSFPSTIDTWTSNDPSSLTKVQSDMNTMTFGTWADPSHPEEWEEEECYTKKLETKEYTPSSRAMTNTTVSDVVRSSNQPSGPTTGAQTGSMDFSSILKQGQNKLPQPSQQAASQHQPPTQPQPQSQQGLGSLLGSTGVPRPAANTPNQAGAALLQQLQQGTTGQNVSAVASTHAANVPGGAAGYSTLSPLQKAASDNLKNLVGISGNTYGSSLNAANSLGADPDPIRQGQQSAVAAVKAVTANATGSSQHSRANVRPSGQRTKIPDLPVEMPGHQHDSIGSLGVEFSGLQFGDTTLEFHNQSGSSARDKPQQKDPTSKSLGTTFSNSYVRGPPNAQSSDSAIKAHIPGADLGGVTNSVLGAAPSLNADSLDQGRKYTGKVGSGLNDHSKLSYPVSTRSAANAASDMSSSYGPSASDSGLIGSSSVSGGGVNAGSYSVSSAPTNSYMSNYPTGVGAQSYPSSYGSSAASQKYNASSALKDLESSTNVSSSAQPKSHYDQTTMSGLTGGSSLGSSTTVTTTVLHKTLPANALVTSSAGKSGVPTNVPPGVAGVIPPALDAFYAPGMQHYPFPIPPYASMNAFNPGYPSMPSQSDQYYRQQEAGKFRVSESESGQNPSSVAGSQPQSVAPSQAPHAYQPAFPPGYGHPGIYLPGIPGMPPAQNLYQVPHGTFIHQMTPQSGSSSSGYGPKGGNSGYGSHAYGSSGYDSFPGGAGMQTQDAYGSKANSYGSGSNQGPKGLSSGGSDLSGNSTTGIYGKAHAPQLKSNAQQSYNIQSGSTGFGSPYNTSHYTPMMQHQSSGMMHHADVGSNQRGGGGMSSSGHKGSSSSSNIAGKTFYQSPTGSSTWGAN